MRFSPAALLAWLLGLVLLSISACAHPLAAAGPDLVLARAEMTATRLSTTTLARTPSPAPSLQSLSYHRYLLNLLDDDGQMGGQSCQRTNRCPDRQEQRPNDPQSERDLD